jgi:hypothetical protein
MAKPKTHFEQVPLREIKAIVVPKVLGFRQQPPENLIIERPDNKREPYTRPARPGEAAS